MNPPSPRFHRALLVAFLVGCGNGGATEKYNFTTLEPAIETAPQSIDFGGVVVPYDASRSFTILNAGASDLNIESITVGGDNPGMFEIDVTEGVVEPDQTLDVTVTFAPNQYEDYFANVEILSDDPASPVMSVPVSGSGIDGPVPELVIDPGALDFGLVEVGTTAQLSVDIRNEGGGELTVTSLNADGQGAFSLLLPSTGLNEFTIPGDSLVTAVYEYTPTGTTGDNASLEFSSNDPLNPEQSLFLLGNGGGDFQYPVAEIDCPDTVTPPGSVTLDGRGSADPMNPAGELIYEWSILSTPSGSSTTEVAEPDKSITNMFADLAGQYQVQLVVENEAGLRSTPDLCVMDAIPPKNVHVELIWDTGNSDLDLHMVQGDGDLFGPQDCYYQNQNPSWEGGDPTLALDNRAGYGPENINMDSPANGDYRVHVHYFEDKGGGDSVATVRVWLNGAIEWEGSALLSQKYLWDVGFIRWTDGTGVFQPYSTDPYPRGED